MPSLREKKRYIAFEVQAEQKVSLEQVRQGIEEGLQRLLGELGMARAGILFLRDWKNNRGIMKVDTKYVDEIKAALALIQEIAEHRAVVRSVGVSGALAKLRGVYF